MIIFRYRVKAIQNISEKVHANWQPPDPAALHWDGKLMETLTDKYAKDDRLPVLLSGIGGVKLLGVPALPVKSSQPAGDLISNATVDLLRSWNCTTNVAAMVFDTTASNTGHLTAGCICIQRKLDRALLWCACRKHVGEIILTRVWDSLNVEVSKSKDVSVFVKFRDNFNKLPHADSDAFTYVDQDMNQFLIDQKVVVMEFLQRLREHPNADQILIRCDYHELLNLCLAYLGGSEGYSLHKPGATHKARWMGKLLYSLKIVLLEKHVVDVKIVSKTQLAKIKRFVTFVIFVYVPWWYTCANSTAAPANDLLLINNIRRFTEIDATIGNAALKAMQNHLWYLVPEMVALAFFDENLNDTEKQRLANEILKYPRNTTFEARHGESYGKPTFPKIHENTTLVDLIGTDSWHFFDLMKIDYKFLNTNVSTWYSDEGYIAGKKVADALRVTNDSAERGVKLAADFLQAAKSEERFQDVLQVVENSRNSCSDQRKPQKRYNPEKWYLVL